MDALEGGSTVSKKGKEKLIEIQRLWDEGKPWNAKYAAPGNSPFSTYGWPDCMMPITPLNHASPTLGKGQKERVS